jgi:hypothetical protein
MGPNGMNEAWFDAAEQGRTDLLAELLDTGTEIDAFDRPKPVEHDVGQIGAQARYGGIAFAGSRTQPAEAGSNRERRIDAVGLRCADRNDPR